MKWDLFRLFTASLLLLSALFYLCPKPRSDQCTLKDIWYCQVTHRESNAPD